MDLIYNNKVFKTFTEVARIINTQITSPIKYTDSSQGIENLINLEIIISTERKLRTSRVKHKLSNRNLLRKVKK